jgi:hypothetical protein
MAMTWPVQNVLVLAVVARTGAVAVISVIPTPTAVTSVMTALAGTALVPSQ